MPKEGSAFAEQFDLKALMVGATYRSRALFVPYASNVDQDVTVGGDQFDNEDPRVR